MNGLRSFASPAGPYNARTWLAARWVLLRYSSHTAARRAHAGQLNRRRWVDGGGRYSIVGGPAIPYQQEDFYLYHTKRGFHALFHGMDPWPGDITGGRHTYVESCTLLTLSVTLPVESNSSGGNAGGAGSGAGEPWY